LPPVSGREWVPVASRGYGNALRAGIEAARGQEAGVPTAEVCRRHGVSSAMFYKWKGKFGGLEVSEAKRLKALEDENGRLKRMLADAMLDNAALKDLLGKRW
jgi:putative transposase